MLDEARAALDAHYAEELGGPFVSAGLCLYRDGSDSVAWHGDRIARESPRDTMVAIVSLGATRPFALRPRSGGPGLRLQVGHGDLLVMGGSCQRTWLHAHPEDGARARRADQHPVPPRLGLDQDGDHGQRAVDAVDHLAVDVGRLARPGGERERARQAVGEHARRGL